MEVVLRKPCAYANPCIVSLVQSLCAASPLHVALHWSTLVMKANACMNRCRLHMLALRARGSKLWYILKR